MKRWGLRGLLVVVLVAVGCGSGHREELARKGQIDDSAKVKAELEITVDAPVEKVWGVLTDIPKWPVWQADIQTAKIAGPVAVGTEFVWSTGTTVHSRIAVAKPNEEFGWTGRAYQVTAIHIWKLERLDGNRTRVKMSESMDGLMLTAFFTSKKLADVDQVWLERLKVAAEK